MKRVTATAIGILFAAGLAFAAPKATPKDLVNRYYAAGSGTGEATSWQDWHPDAVHNIIVQTRMEEQDWNYSYRISDWETLPDWTENPEFRDAMQGYEETSRSAPKVTVAADEEATVATAKTQVSYIWENHKGVMAQTDRFEIVTLAGQSLIRSLTTTYDYR